MANGYESVVIIGSSGAGKSTLVDGVRGPEYASSVVIPLRYSTRVTRQGDNPLENEHKTPDAFEEGIRSDLITPYWQRNLDHWRTTYYGFEKLPDDEKRLKIYSANNAFIRNQNKSVERVLASGLIVVVAADKNLREERLFERSPDITYSERQFRLNDEFVTINGQEEIIRTTGKTPLEGQAMLQSLVKAVLRFNEAAVQATGDQSLTLADFKS